jgi:hypothetical protein
VDVSQSAVSGLPIRVSGPRPSRLSRRRRRPRARGRALAALLAAAVTLLLAAPAADAITSGDAYATQGASQCSWTMGTGGIEKVVGFGLGTYGMTSLKNKLVSPAREYVQGGVASPEFSFSWDGTPLTGATGGWTCAAGSAATTTVGGQAAVKVDVALTRGDARVDQHYVVFPSTSVIRQTTEYANLGASAHTLGTPSLVEQHVMGSDIAAGDVDLHYMTGAACCNAQAWTLQRTRLTSSYARNFDSYDPFGCVDSGSTPSSCTPAGFAETSSRYIPWFALSDASSGDGLVSGFDSFARWRARVGATGGAGALSLDLPGYSAGLAPGEHETMGTTFAMTYAGDLDDMGNRVLDWQYRYLWDYTRADYFAGVAAPGNWCAGTQWCGNWDQQGIRQKIYNLSDRERQIGIDTDWRDNGWWDAAGDWNGPDFRLTNDLLAKAGQRSIIYYPAYGANTGSATYASHPDWFANGSPCGYTERLGDLSIPAFETHMLDLMTSNAQRWGDHEFRNDACPITNSDGRTQLRQDQAFRRVLRGFLDARPGSAFYDVDSGGNEIGWDEVRMASQQQTYDTPETDKMAVAAYLFPIDKLSGDPNPWSATGYCSHAIWQNLGFNASFYSDAAGNGFGNGDTVDPAKLDCARTLIDTYHYLAEQGVVGRWVRQYHPVDGATGDWFERLSQDRSKGTIHRFGASTSASVTVHPKGLDSATTYDVRYQFRSGSASRSGSDLMANGIAFPAGVDQGEVVYLNLAKHPGAGTDTSAPSAPSNVTATAATNVSYPGVDVNWRAGADDNHVSRYDVYRDGVKIGTTAKGTYFHDHTPAASPYAQYAIKTLDGDDNASAAASSTPPHGEASFAVDDAAMGASGFTRLTGQVGNFADTLSGASASSATISYSFTGTAVTLYVKLGPNEGKANVTVDGVTDTIDLYAPDNLDAIVPIWSKTWARVGAHTVSVSPTGSHNAKSSGDTIYVDGLQVLEPEQTVTEDSATGSISYGGTWSHATGVTGASNSDLSSSSATGATASYTFESSRVRLIGRTCASCGEADVYVDGSYDARIDLWGDRGAQVDRTVVYDRSFPTSGAHTVRVVVTGLKNLESSGTTIALDAVQADAGGVGTGGPGPGPGPGASGPYATAVAADRPVTWLRLDDASSSSVAADASGSGNNGTVHGGVTFGSAGALASEPSSTGAGFDGSSGWIDVGNPSALQVSDGTVEGWVKTTSTDATYHAIAIKWYAYGLFLHNGRLVAYDWGGGAERDSGVSIADGQWHHVAMTFHSGTANATKLYVDGAAVLTTTISVQRQTGDALVSNGATTMPQQFFPGTLDEIAYYGSALSASRVQAHVDAARYGGMIAAAGPTAWYRLDDVAPTTTVADASGHAHAGTLHGGVAFGASGALAHDPDTAASLDGSSGWIDLGNPAALQTGSGSIEAWVKTSATDATYHAIAIKWYAYGLFVRGGTLVTYDWGTETPRDTGVSIADGQWHHVVLTFASGTTNGTRVYVDGSLALTTTITVGRQGAAALIGAGSTDPVQLFPGTLDEVAWYDRILPAGEVAAHRAAGVH